mgnify:FL=1|tara:strand:+ start:1651 stop:3090 length:1440 start_codon:yes stop_codon:yes gene_type:complete
MKWIGQHIWDTISRFRDDIYLEGVSSGTIASGGNLGLDSNNKIVKATVSGGSLSGDNYATDLKIGRDADNLIDFTTDNNIVIRANGENQLTLVNGALTPTTNAIVDLGTDALEFKDGYFDGTLEVDNLTIGGSQGNDGQVLTSTGSGVAWEDAAGGGSVSGNTFATDLKIGRDADNLIDFTTDNQITFRVSAGDGVVMKASGEIEATDIDISGVMEMDSDKKLSFGHSSTFLEGATSGSKLMLNGQTDIFFKVNLSTIFQMDGSKIECSQPLLPASNDGAALGSATKMWSDVYCAGNIELGHATDTTIARSAAGTVTIEGKEIMTKDKKIHIQQTAFNDDLGTTEHFIPFNTTTEHANITNIAIPMVMPVAGKLLKIHMRVNQNHNTTSNTVTFKLYDVDNGEIWNAGNSDVLGTKVIDGTAKENVMIADFTDLTTSGASGTNAFSAGDLIGVTLQNSVDLATTNYLVTMVFELDFSSY